MSLFDTPPVGGLIGELSGKQMLGMALLEIAGSMQGNPGQGLRTVMGLQQSQQAAQDRKARQEMLDLQKRKAEAELGRTSAYQDFVKSLMPGQQGAPSGQPMAGGVLGAPPEMALLADPTQTTVPAIEGAAIPAPFGPDAPRGLRNNNPGNIRLTDISWQGEVPGRDTGFETFASPVDGLSALAQNLRTYGSKHGINTLQGLAERYAPASDGNDPANYARFLSSQTGIPLDAQIDLTDRRTLETLMPAIVEMENGRNPYDQGLYGMALDQRLGGGQAQQPAQPPTGRADPMQVADAGRFSITPQQAQMLAMMPPEEGMRLIFEMQNQPAKAPETRTIEVGDEKITQEFDPRRGGWVEVGRAARSNRDAKTPWEMEDTLRDEVRDLAKTTGFMQTQDNFNTLMSAKPTGAGDLAMVFSYMKLLDQNSAVMEGEQATARNAPGVPAAIQGEYNRLLGGGSLSDTARQQFRDMGASIYENRWSQFNSRLEPYRGIAERNKLNVDNILLDFARTGSPAPAPEPGRAASAAAPDNDPLGIR